MLALLIAALVATTVLVANDVVLVAIHLALSLAALTQLNSGS